MYMKWRMGLRIGGELHQTCRCPCSHGWPSWRTCRFWRWWELSSAVLQWHSANQWGIPQRRSINLIIKEGSTSYLRKNFTTHPINLDDSCPSIQQAQKGSQREDGMFFLIGKVESRFRCQDRLRRLRSTVSGILSKVHEWRLWIKWYINDRLPRNNKSPPTFQYTLLTQFNPAIYPSDRLRPRFNSGINVAEPTRGKFWPSKQQHLYQV